MAQAERDVPTPKKAVTTLVCTRCGEYTFSVRLKGCLSCYASAEDQDDEPGPWSDWGD